MATLRTVRKLILGETRILPACVLVAVGGALIVRALAGTQGWWHSAGGFVLLGLVTVGVVVIARAAAPRRRERAPTAFEPEPGAEAEAVLTRAE